MKREIKFRAWHNGKMWGSEYRWDRDDDSLLRPIDWEDVSYLCHILRGTEDRYFSAKDWELMQFTGLHDKNGKEIYEGDIINILITFPLSMTQKIVTTYVEFDNGAFSPFEKQTEYYPYILANSEIIEVIGNIYENPELIK